MGIDAANNCIRIWQQLNGAHTAIFASRLTLGSGAGTVSLIASNSLFDLVGPAAGNSANPRVTFDSNGRAIAVWEQIDAGSVYDIWADRFE